MDSLKPPSRHIELFVATIFGVLWTPLFAIAGEGEWNDLMRGGGIVVDHQPYNSGGMTSDTLFRENEFLPPTWQSVGDSFLLTDATTIGRINFWGFYHLNSLPSASESFRVRVYESRVLDNLPGEVLYEANFTDVARAFTGQFIITYGAPAEYFFSLNLQTPFHAALNQLYWLEIVQVGDLDSRFRWEFSRSGELNGQAFDNPFVNDWTSITHDSNTAFQLVPVPEPGSVCLFAMVLLLQIFNRKKRQLSNSINRYDSSTG